MRNPVKNAHKMFIDVNSLCHLSIEKYFAVYDLGFTQDRIKRLSSHAVRLSRNTACSPNRFQNHHGTLSRNGAP